MIELSENEDLEEDEKYNKRQYERRFGISYSSKGLKLNFNEGISRKNTKFKGSNLFSRENSRRSTIKENSIVRKNTKRIFNEVNEIDINRIYDNIKKVNEHIIPISNFFKINKCPIIKYGIKMTTDEIEYSYCKTCDHNLIRPICLHCINNCHKNHLTSYIFSKGKIKCFCGEKNHNVVKINNKANEKNIKCSLFEWNLVSKLGFYYINKKSNPICIFCHNYCQKSKNNKIMKMEECNNNLECSCTNEEIHESHKITCEKIINLIKDDNEYNIFLNQIQFINMLFKNKNNFKRVFEDFAIFMNKVNEKEISYFSKFHLINITNTVIYKTLFIFEFLIQKQMKGNYIYYYIEDIINYFSFNSLKNLYFVLENSSLERKSICLLINKFLFFFHKIYINFKTQALHKFKLVDLKNLSFLQRIIIFDKNKNIFQESEEIISYLLKKLKNIISNDNSSFFIDSIKSIKEIMIIFRKLACYNLINNEQMTYISINIIKCFDYIRIVRNTINTNHNKNTTHFKSKEELNMLDKNVIKIFYIILKIIMNFIYNYNDNILNVIIFNKEKYHNIDDINMENAYFIYKKNELGRFILKINLLILSNIQNSKIYHEKNYLIQRLGVEILQYFLNKEDDYILNIINSLNQIKYYFKNSNKLLINNNQYHKEYVKQSNLISNNLYQYFTFDKKIEETLNVINDSLNTVLGELSDNIFFIDDKENEKELNKGFNFNQTIAILSTDYLNIISKVIGIIFHYQERSNVLNNSKISSKNELDEFIEPISVNIEDEIIKKILYFYYCFAFDSSDNSLLILSNTIFIQITKIPVKYCQLSFKLFYICIKNILSLDNNNESGVIFFDQTSIIKRLFNYLEKLFEDKKIKLNYFLSCIYYFLKIIEMALFNSYSLSFNNFIYKIQYILVTIGKKYELINKYFDMKDSEIISHKKLIRNKSANFFVEFQNENTNYNPNNFVKNNTMINSSSFEIYKKNILQNSFVIYIKLINDCFDFTISTDRKKIQEIINIDKIIFALQYYIINLDLRTEFLRLLRKILLDVKYSNNDNDLYAKTIINSKDNLNFIKDNMFINNMNYPTKLLNFLNNFYNITAKCVLQENLKEKMKMHLNSQKLNHGNKSEVFNEDKNKIKKIDSKHYYEEAKENIKIDNEEKMKINIFYEDDKEIKTISTKKYLEEQDLTELKEDLKTQKSLMEPNYSRHKSIKSNFINMESNNMNDVNSIIVEENPSKIAESEINQSKISNDINYDNEYINKNKSRKSLFEFNKKTVIENEKSAFMPTSLKKGSFLDIKRYTNPNNIIIPPNQRKSIILNEECDIDTDELEKIIEIMNQNNKDKFYYKCKEKNILEKAFNEKLYYIINYEIDNIKIKLQNINLNLPDRIEYVRNYIENGLLIPIIFYFKKIFTLIHLFNGEEMIKIFSLVKKSINLKQYISELKVDFWNNGPISRKNSLKNSQNVLFEKNEINNCQNYYYTKYRNASIIDGKYFNDNFIGSTYESLDQINLFKISIFDYSSLYQIIDKEFFSLIKERKVLSNLENLNERVSKILNRRVIKYDEKILIENNMSDIRKRLLKVLIIYKYSKLAFINEPNHSIFNILSEISLDYESNYRKLLVKLLINYGKEKNIKDEFTETSYYILFKLLSIKTIDIQNDIINILGGEENDDPGFLKDFGNILFHRIILLLIDYLNPPDKLIQANYFIVYNLIYIFKYLCEEHNFFFQRHLVKSLSFDYTKHIPSFFKFNNINEKISYTMNNGEDISESSININGIEENIPFYDFFLYLLIKIILISDWTNKIKSNNQNENSFLYDLFSSILDLLTEIIQGSKSELLSTLCINMEEKRIIEIIKNKEDFDKNQKVDSFEFFIKYIKNIIFHEINDSSLINKIRMKIMYYITSILENKNCNTTMKKYIKKYININGIYNIISITLKSYYLNKEKPNNLKKIKRPFLNLLAISNFNRLNKTKIERKNSNKNPSRRPKINIMNNNKRNKRRFRYSININTTSNVGLINNSNFLQNTLNRNLSILILEKNKQDNSQLKKILTSEVKAENVLKKNKTHFRENSEKNESLNSNLKIRSLIFDKKLYEYFKQKFYGDAEFIETSEFKLANTFYRYIKIIIYEKSQLKIMNIEQIKKVIDFDGDVILNDSKNEIEIFDKDDIKENINAHKDLLEKYYIERFFGDITNIVEIRTNEGASKLVVYTKLPFMQFLSEESKYGFIRKVNRDTEITKKNDLIRYIDFFIQEIKYYKKYHNKWDFWFLKIDFYYLILFSYLYVLIYNMILLFTVKGDNQISKTNTIKERHQNIVKTQYFIDNSIIKWNSLYNIFDYLYFALNIILIVLWVYKLPLYFKIERIKYRENFEFYKKKKLYFYNKIYILFKNGFFQRNYIFMLIYDFAFSILILIFKRNIIIYSLLLLPILFISRTLKNILISIRLNYDEFFLTFFIAFIIMYLFSNIYFFFFNSDFEVEINYRNDNYCKTLIFSFLNALDNGLRARGGLGDSAKRISFLKNKKHYLIRLILDDIFFLLIVIIMIDMVFGIIVKSFDILRHRHQKFITDKKSYCIICHSNKDLLGKERLNFKEHINITHNLWNYVEYMISLKLKDINDLNYINKYVRDKLDKKDISWLPSYKDIIAKNEVNDSDFEENDMRVLIENFENYKIRTNILNS